MPAILPLLKGLFAGKGSEITANVMNGLDNLFTSKEEKLQKQIEIEALVNAHIEKMAELAQSETEAYLKDMESARNMQIEALKQADNFSKRFIYYFTIGLTFLTLLYDFCFFFIQYPERNHDIINMTAGVLNTGCLVSIINFFYGSSKSSEKKQEAIESMARGNG